MSCGCRCHVNPGAGCDQAHDTGSAGVDGVWSCTPCDAPTVDVAPERKVATPADLWAAVDRLTRPGSVRLRRDNGAAERHPLPSLLDQLVDAMENGAGGKTGRMQESKPPLDASSLSLLLEIAEQVRGGCWNWRLKRSFDIPTDLRAIASAVIAHGDVDLVDKMTTIVRGWCARIRVTISSDPDRTWRMHGAACRVCSSTTVPVWDGDGTETRQPALIVHSEDGHIDHIECGFCGSKLTGDDLTALIFDTRRDIDRARIA